MDYGKLCRVEHESRGPVEAVIDEILSKGASILYMKYVLEKQPRFIGELFTKTCGILIDDFTVTHDKGDDKKIIRRFWPDDKEPVSYVDDPGSATDRLLGQASNCHRQERYQARY